MKRILLVVATTAGQAYLYCRVRVVKGCTRLVRRPLTVS